MFTLNAKQEAIFKREWQNFIARKTRRGGDVPDYPSPGWLSEVAAHNNLCAATGTKDDEPVVCGAELWNHGSDDSYLCRGCYDTRQIAIDRINEELKKRFGGKLSSVGL